MKLRKKQEMYLENARRYGPLFVGDHTPAIKRSFDALVKKGLLVANPANPGWTAYSIK